MPLNQIGVRILYGHIKFNIQPITGHVAFRIDQSFVLELLNFKLLRIFFDEQSKTIFMSCYKNESAEDRTFYTKMKQKYVHC